MRLDHVRPRQQREVREFDTDAERVRCLGFRDDAIHLAADAIHRRAVDARDTDDDDRRAPVPRMHSDADAQRVVVLEQQWRFLAGAIQLHIDQLELRSARGRNGPLRPLAELGLVVGKVRLGDVEHVTARGDFSVAQPARTPAQLLHVIHAVRNQDQRTAAGEIVLHPAHALLLERFVADREHLVGDQDVGLQRGDDGKAEAHDHAGRIMLDRLVDVVADVGELDDLVEALAHLARAESVQRGGHRDVVASRIVRMEPGAEFEQRADAAVDGDAAERRRQHAGQQLEQGRLAGSVLADQPEGFAAAHLDIDVAQHRGRVGVGHAMQQSPERAQAIARAEYLRVGLAQPVRGDEDLAHRKSSKCDARRRNTA